MQDICGIYKIENLINHKCYIGQSIHINRRWYEHRSAGRSNLDYAKKSYLYNALKKYGEKNFSFTIIEECENNIDILNAKEIYWIAYYDSYNNGYNLTAGGDNSAFFLKVKIDQYDLLGNFITTFFSISEAARQGFSSSGNIVNCLKGHTPSAGGYQWRYHGEEAPGPLVYKVTDQHDWSSSKRAISQYTKTGQYIATFDSAHDAARSLEGNRSSGHISECCAGKRKSAYGYIWKYTEEDGDILNGRDNKTRS